MPGVLERFVSSDEANLLRTTFMGLHSLDAEEYKDKVCIYVCACGTAASCPPGVIKFIESFNI